jgi:hypothetical protein
LIGCRTDEESRWGGAGGAGEEKRGTRPVLPVAISDIQYSFIDGLAARFLFLEF